MHVELTMAVAAVCALPSLTAGPAAVLTTKSWMSIMSPAKVLSCFTSREVSKINVEGYGKFITQQELRLLKNSRLYFPFRKLYYTPSFLNLGRHIEEPPPIFL